MVFSSFVFLGAFLPLTMLLYFGSLRFFNSIKAANAILLAGSLVFYAWGEPLWILLLIGIASLNFLFGKWIGAAAGPSARKRLLVASVGADLGALFIFKYMGFAVATVDSLLGLGLPHIDIALPIGISFYTFQSLSYVIDVYRGKVGTQKNYFDFALYVAMFPQLVAGPIVRYADVAAQIDDRRSTLPDCSAGVKRFCAGLCKKVLLANRFGAAASVLLDGNLSGLPMSDAWAGALFFAMQIYFDFSGYSDMAIGLGRIFGFEFKENFDYPYISKSITEFWRRWHMSLSSFFRDYVYIPLGGNRRMQLRNILAVWALTGLWHGASWNFVLWGLYHGVLLIVEKWAGNRRWSLPGPVAWLVSMCVVLFGWGIFYLTDFSQLVRFGRAFLGLNGVFSVQSLRVETVWFQNIWLLAVGLAAATPLPRKLYQRFVLRQRLPALIWNTLVVTGAFFACFVFLVGESYNPFLYFRF